MGVAVTLVVSAPGVEIQSITLDQPRIVVGRGASADLRLPSRGVSTQHAVIHVLGAEAWVIDDGSTHGTRVNGTLIPRGRKKALHGGDVVGVATYEIRVDISPTMADPPERTGTLARRLLLGALATVGSTAASPLLVLTTGKRAGESWKLRPGRTVLGRGDDCDVVLDDADCSRHHVEIVRDADGSILRDLGSMNGVFMGERRLTDRRLRQGDEITLGKTTVRFDDPAEELLRSFDGGADEPIPPSVPPPKAEATSATSSVPVVAPKAESPMVPLPATGSDSLRVTAPPANEGSRSADWIVVALAVVILAVSVVALLMVLRSGPGH